MAAKPSQSNRPRGNRLLLLIALAPVLALAGCASESPRDAPDDPPATSTPERLSEGPATPADAMEDLPRVQVYRYDELTTGSTMPSDDEPTFTQTFTAPDGTVGLEVFAGPGDGAGNLRVEILGPDGEVAFRGREWTQVEAAGASAGSRSMDERTAEGLGPGDYTVRVFVGGAISVFVAVDAVVDAPA